MAKTTKIEKDLYIIIGNASVGKSSICRALTGIYSNGIKALSYKNNEVINTFIYPRSLQELKINVNEAINLLQSKNTKENIITLRFNKYNNCESALEYINSIIKKQWVIKGLVFLGDYDLTNYPKTIKKLIIKEPDKVTINLNAKKVRAFFNLI